MTRRILFAGLALGPVVIALHYFTNVGDTALFALAAAALIPLAWLIGEATEHAAEHTGPGIGGFLNATFGNAPELIIALIAIHEGLTDVVRGSLTGSVVGNLLLVLGFSLFAGGRGEIERWSSFLAFGMIGLSIGLFLIPSIPSWSGDPDAQRIVDLSIPVAIVLLAIYAIVTVYTLRRHSGVHIASDEEIEGWSFKPALAALGVATVITALVAEVLVGSLETFAHKVGLSDFFVAAVIVAIVGNAAEHGGAVIVAYRGKIKLAAEIALSSSAQVAMFLIPAVVLLSWLIDPLALGFRKVEIAALVISLAVVMATIWGGKSSRLRGSILIAAYIGVAAMFFIAGDIYRNGSAEGLRRARERVRREVELLDRAVLGAHGAEQLAALAAFDDAPAVGAVGLEPRDVAPGGASDERRLEAAARATRARSPRPPSTRGRASRRAPAESPAPAPRALASGAAHRARPPQDRARALAALHPRSYS